MSEQVQTIKILLPGYKEETEYDLSKIFGAYDGLASAYNISDPKVKAYYNELVNAAAAGNLKITGSGTLQVSGSALGLRNQYDNTSQISDEYKNNNESEFRRGINEENKNNIDDKSHGIFTSKGTRNFREDQNAKATAGAIFLKALTNSVYTPPKEEAPAAYNGDQYWRELIGGQLGGNPKLYSTLSAEDLLRIRRLALQQAINDADTFYGTRSWDKIPGMTKEKWKESLTSALTALQDDNPDNDTIALAILGFSPNEFTQTEHDDTTGAVVENINNPLTYATADAYAEAQVKAALAKQAAPLAADVAENIRTRAINEFTQALTRQKKIAADLLELQQVNAINAKFNPIWEAWIGPDEDIVTYHAPNFSDLDIFTNEVGANVPGTRDKDWYLDKTGAIQSSNTNKRTLTANNVENLLNKIAFSGGVENLMAALNPETAGAAFDEAGNQSLNRLLAAFLVAEATRLHYAHDGKHQDIVRAIDQWLGKFLRKTNEGLYILQTNDGKLTDLIIGGTDLTNKSVGYGIVYDPTEHKFIKRKYHKIGGDDFKKRVQEAWWEANKDKLEGTLFQKNGGVLKMEKGGGFNADFYKKMAKEALQEPLTTSKEPEPDHPDKIVGAPGAHTRENVDGLEVTELDSRTKARITAAASDIVSMLASFGANPISAGVSAGAGLTSTAINAYQDFTDDSVSAWLATGNLLAGLGADALGIIPFFGGAAKIAKIVKYLRPAAASITAAMAVAGATNGVSALGKLMSKPSEMTINDWKDLTTGLVAITNATRGAFGRQYKMNIKNAPKVEKVRPILGADNKVRYIPVDTWDVLKNTTDVNTARNILIKSGMSAEEAAKMANTLASRWSKFGRTDTGMRLAWGPGTAFRSAMSGNYHLRPGALFNVDKVYWGTPKTAATPSRGTVGAPGSIPLDRKGGSIPKFQTPAGPITYKKDAIQVPAWFKYAKELLGFNSEDYNANYKTKAANTINNGYINNEWHKSPTAASRYSINQQYTSNTAYDTKKKDFEKAMQGIAGNDTLTAELLRDEYNKHVGNISNIHTNRLWNTSGDDVATANKSHKLLYGSLNEANALNYDEAQQHIYGTTSYLRIPQLYEKELEQATDDDFKNRVVKYKVGDKDTYYGFNADGTVRILTDDEIKRYNGTTAEMKEKPAASNGSVQTGGTGELGNIITKVLDSLKNTDFSNWIIRPDLIVGLGRMFTLLATNKRSLNELLKYKPLLLSSYHDNALVYGDYLAKAQGERTAAQLQGAVSKPFTSDASMQLAGTLEATGKGLAAKATGAAADAEKYYTKLDAANAINMQNAKRDNAIYNSNITDIINPHNQEVAHLKANYEQTKGDIRANWLAGVQQEYINAHDRNLQYTKENAQEEYLARQKQIYAQYLNDHDPVKMNESMKKATEAYRKNIGQVFGGFRTVWQTPRFVKLGSKLTYHDRVMLQSAKDFNAAMRKNKKYLYDVTSLNHKTRKK